MSRWYRMDERKPEDELPAGKESVKVLVAFRGANNAWTMRTETRVFYSSSWRGPAYWDWKRDGVRKDLHWMPLPHPPGSPMTRADEMRSLTDEGLARMLVRGNACELFCRNEARCRAALISDEEIPEEWCVGCALLWLREVE